MRDGRLLLKAGVPLALFAAVWGALLLFHAPFARWCSLSVREPIVPGEPVRVIVSYSVIGTEAAPAGASPSDAPSTGVSPEGFILSADIHWQTTTRERKGYMASGKNVPGVRGEGSRDFLIEVKDLPDLGFIGFVVYLSPNGKWSDRLLAARTAYIRVRPRHGLPGGERIARAPELAFALCASGAALARSLRRTAVMR